MEPNVIDIYTSSTTSLERRKVFSPGEGIRWNAVHTVREPGDIGRRYRMIWVVEFYENRSVRGTRGSFEVLFRPQIVARGDFIYRHEATHNFWWFDSIPEISGELMIPGESPREVLDALRRGDPLQLFFPGFWKLTVHVMMTEADTGRPFGTRSDWHYSILSS